MQHGFFVQTYRMKGSKLIGQASLGFAHLDQAIAEGRRLAPWRAGIVVFRQEIDGEGLQRGRPSTLAIHGRVPPGWLQADRAAA